MLKTSVCAAAVVAAVATFIPSAARSQTTPFRVVLLGTGSPLPSTGRLGPSILVEAGVEKLVFDVGRGVFVRLDQLHIPFADITGVLLTHLHSDHVSGLPDLWLTGRFEGQARDADVDLWGPAGTASMASHLTEAYQFDLGIRARPLPTQGRLTAHDIVEGPVLSRHGVSVSAFMVHHGNVAPAVGYRIDYGGRSVVLSGDTNFSEHLIDKAAGADLLIHEVAAAAESAATPNTARVLRLHTSPEEAGRVFARVHPKLAVYSHIVAFGVTDDELVARTRKTYSGPLVVGADLMSFDVADVVTMTNRARLAEAPPVVH